MADDPLSARPDGPLKAPGPCDAFACHNSKDKPEVREICRELRDRGISVWIDEDGIRPGDRYRQVILDAIEAAAVHLVFCSAHGLGPFQDDEYELILALRRRIIRIIPILLPGAALRNVPPWLQHTAHVVDFSEAVHAEGLDAIAEVIRSGIPQTPAEDSRRKEAQSQWAATNLPARNEFFTGREKELGEIAEQLAQRGVAVLTGMGGTGKTGTAKEYAHRHRAEYGHVFWVSADNPTVLLAGLVEIARLVGILPRVAEPEEMDQKTAVQHLKLWLGQHDGWLLVADNADDDADQSHKTDMLRAVKDALPSEHGGHVLVTTRRSRIDDLGTVDAVEIVDLLASDAVDFLLRRTGRQQSSPQEQLAATDLAQALGYLALALEQAAAFIYAKRVAFADYLASYRRNLESQRKYLLEHAPVMGERDHRPLITTWQMNVEQLEPSAADLLRLLAYLHPEEIPLELITAGGAQFSETLAKALTDDDPLSLNVNLIEPLCRYSLVAYDEETRTLSIHRIVQQVLLANLDEAARRDGAEAAVAALAAAHAGFDFEHWDTLQRWLPHALVAADWVEQYQIEDQAAGLLLNQAGYFLHDQGRYGEAEPLYARSLAIDEKVYGPEHPNVATALNNLALLYSAQGKYAEAEPLQLRDLAICEKALGPEHPNVATSLNNLAGLYKTHGKYADAEPLYARSLAILEKALGPDHPVVATSLNNLAGLYCDQGKYADAEPLYARSLAIREKALGPEHPDVATALNNLAGLYHDQGQYAEAEPLYARSLAIREKALGPEHPYVATTLNNLAELYRDQGKYAEAEPLYARSLAIVEKVLGPDHPDVATSLNNLASLYHARGKYAEAEPLYARSLVIDEKVYGPDHPEVATDLNNLALLYRDQGKYAEAEPLYARSLAILEKALGPEHPYVAGTLNNLALLYRDQGQYAEAEPLYARSLAIREKALGPEHPDVANSLWNLAGLRRAQERDDEAAELFARALSIFEAVLPAEHPHVGELLIQYAAAAREVGRDQEADALEARGREIRARYGRSEGGWSLPAFPHAAPFDSPLGRWPRPHRGRRPDLRHERIQARRASE